MDIVYVGVLLLFLSPSSDALEKELVLGADIDNPDWTTKELCEEGMEIAAADMVKTFNLEFEKVGGVGPLFWTTKIKCNKKQLDARV